MKAALSPQVEPVADSRAWRVLGSSTFAFTICFAVWMMFAILGIPLKKQLHLTDTEFGLIAAMPVLTGSLARVPLGIWTDRFGGRIVFFITMLATVVPIWLVSYATQLWQFLALGLFVGGGRRIVPGRHALCRALVSEVAPGARRGHLRRGQFGRRARAQTRSRRSSATSCANWRAARATRRLRVRSTGRRAR